MRSILPILLALPALLGVAPSQPEPRGAVSPDRRVDVQSLHLDLVLDVVGGSVEGTATHVVSPLRRGLKEIVLNQVGLDVQRVTVDGAQVPFTLEPTTLHIALPEPSAVGEALTVATTYQATPSNGLNFRRTRPAGQDAYDEVWSQGEDTDNRYWFPGWDAPGDRFTFSMDVSVEDRFVAVSNGTLQSRVADPDRPGWTRWSWSLGDSDLVNYLVMVAAAPYERGESAWRGRPLMWFTPPGTDTAVAAHTVGRIPAMLDYFSEVTGIDYPYAAYNEIFVQRFLYTGMENTASTVLDARLLHPKEYETNRLRGDAVLAHELAHQWYGDLLTCRTWRELWLNEGFATFFGGEWMGHDKGPFYAARTVLHRYQAQFRADEGSARPLVVDYTNRGESGRPASPYVKGASTLQMLRVLVGEEPFWRGIRRYTGDHQHQDVETADLRRALEDESGFGLRWFFDQWTRSLGHPVLDVTARMDEEAGALRIGLKQSQSAEWPTFTLPVDVEIATTTGSSVHRIWMDERSGGALVPITGDLLYVAVDPEGGLMAEVHLDQGPAAWTVLLQQSPHPYARVWALDHLKDVVPDDALRAAVTAILSDRTADLTLRALSADLLAAWGQEADFNALIAALDGEPDGGLRESLVGALGRSVPRDAVRLTLIKALGGDPIVDVRAAALTSLGALEGEAVRRRAIPMLRARSGPLQLVERAAAGVLKAWGRPGDVSALSTLRGAATQHNTRMAAWSASVALVNEAPVADRPTLRLPLAREAERMLQDRHLRARQRAIAVLRSVGDARSVLALQNRRSQEAIPAVRTSIDAAVEAIRARKDSEPQPVPAEVDARLKGLKERLDETEKELKALQERY